MQAREIVLVTRFNVRRGELLPPDYTWLQKRLSLFESAPLPAVQSQTVQPDRWLLYCDEASPTWFRDRVHALAAAYAPLEPVWVGGGIDLPTDLQARVQAIRVVCVRLDNDDAISRDYLASLVQHDPGQGTYFLNVTSGLQYSAGRLYMRLDRSNAFIGLSEPVGPGMIGVFVDWHTRLAGHAPVLQIGGPARWLQVIHGENLGNRLTGVRVHNRGLDAFDVRLPVLRTSWFELRRDQLVTGWRLGVLVVRSPGRLGRALRMAVDPTRHAQGPRDTGSARLGCGLTRSSHCVHGADR